LEFVHILYVMVVESDCWHNMYMQIMQSITV